jgi:hypothetical protein
VAWRPVTAGCGSRPRGPPGDPHRAGGPLAPGHARDRPRHVHHRRRQRGRVRGPARRRPGRAQLRRGVVTGWPSGSPSGSPCSPTSTPGRAPTGPPSWTSSRPRPGAARAAGRRGPATGGGSRCPHGRSWSRSWGEPGGARPRGAARMRAHAAALPVRTATQALSVGNPAAEKLPKLLISCSIPLAQVRQMIADGHPWFTALAGPEWSFLELPTGHWPMFSVPEELADLLGGLDVAGRGDVVRPDSPLSGSSGGPAGPGPGSPGRWRGRRPASRCGLGDDPGARATAAALPKARRAAAEARSGGDPRWGGVAGGDAGVHVALQGAHAHAGEELGGQQGQRVPGGEGPAGGHPDPERGPGDRRGHGWRSRRATRTGRAGCPRRRPGPSRPPAGPVELGRQADGQQGRARPEQHHQPARGQQPGQRPGAEGAVDILRAPSAVGYAPPPGALGRRDRVGPAWAGSG